MKSIILICLCAASIWAVPVERKLVPVKADRGGRIIGGTAAAVGEFPWQVAVNRVGIGGTNFCGGALIDPKWVLTAAACVRGGTLFSLQLGSNYRSNPDTHRLTISATYSEIHQDYDPTDIVNDIALIRIDTPVTLNDYIQVIPITTSSPQPDGYVDVIISGWGTTSISNGLVENLNYVNLTVISTDDCQAAYDDSITDDMLCAVGATTEGICRGDQGGPLISRDADGNAVHVGVASFIGSDGCLTRDPSGYTKTEAFIDWITSIITA